MWFLALCLSAFSLFAAPTGLSPTTAESPFELLTAAQKDYLYVKTFEERRTAAEDANDTYDRLFCYGSPVELKWTGTTGTCTVAVKRTSDGRVVWTGTTDELSVTVYNLEIGATYEWTVTDSTGASSARFTTSGLTPRLIRTGLVRNLRDLGGWTGTLGGKQYKIRQNLIFRGAAVDDPKATGTQPPYLIEDDSDRDFFYNVVRLKNEVDLRNLDDTSDVTTEARQSGQYKLDPTGEHVTYNNCPFTASSALSASGGFFNALKLLLDPDKLPAYFHCKSGRDRTGMVGAFLLALLGVSRDDIVLDYQTTSDQNNWSKYGFSTFLDTSLGQYQKGTTSLAENARAFLLKNGITSAQVEAFRETMLEGYVAGDAVPANFCLTPYLQRPASDAMTIIFFTDSACKATVEAGLANAEGTPRLRETTTGEWAQALTNSVFHLNRNDNEEKNKWNNSLYRHRVRFEGLRPNRIYDYTVTLPGGATYSNTFRTAPDKDTPIRFVTYADCETQQSNHRNEYTSNLNRMKSRDPDLITTAGDLTARGGIQSHWDEFWMQNAGGNGIGYTDILGSIPMITPIGNHDLFDNAEHTVSGGWFQDRQGEVATEKFLSYFEFNSNNVPYRVRDGTNIPETRDMSQLFHREDYGPVTLIFLDTNNGKDGDTDADHDRDTNYDKPGDSQHTEGGMDRRKGARHPDFNPGSLQYNWLTNQLADAQKKSRFTFVFNHHCPYSVGGHNKSWTTGEDASALAVRVLTETMVRYGVDGWYCGHDELLEHSITNGYEILPNGQRRRHTLSIYDVGCSGDSPRSSSGADNPLKYWQGSSNYGGTGSYGFLETDVTTNRNGQWTCTITPVQGSSGDYLSAQVVYVEDPDRGENQNDLVYAQASNNTGSSNKIDGASQTKPSDWLPWTKPPEGPAWDESVEVELTDVIATDLTYDGTEQKPRLTVKAGDLIVPGDHYTVSPSSVRDANTYSVTVTGTRNVTGSKTVSFKVNRAQVTVTANPVSMVVGTTPEPALTATVSGLQGGDSKSCISYSISRDPGDAIDRYAIRVTGDKVQGNYDVIFVNGWFTIKEDAAFVAGEDAEIEVDGETTVDVGETAIKVGKVTIRGTGDLMISNCQNLTASSIDLNGLDGTVTYEYVSSSANRSLPSGLANTIKGQTDQKARYVFYAFRGTTSANGWNLGSWDKTAFSTHIVIDAGTHTWSQNNNGVSGNVFGKNGTDENPTLLVKDGATLNFTGKDLSGYQNGFAEGGVIRVNAGGTLNFLKPSGSNPNMNYRQRLVLDPGSLTTFAYGTDKFVLHGSGATPGTATEETANIYVPASDGTAGPAILRCASSNGAGLCINNTSNSRGGGCAIWVGANSRLLLDSKVSKGEENDSTSNPRILAKLGPGELEITGEVTSSVNFDARAGIVTLPASSGAFNGGLTAAKDVTYRFPSGWADGAAYTLGSGTVTGTAPAANAATVYVGGEKLTGATLAYSGKTVKYVTSGGTVDPVDPPGPGSDENVTLNGFHAGMETNFTTATKATLWNCKSSDEKNLAATIVRNDDGTATVTVRTLYAYGSTLTVKVYSGSSTAGSGTLVRTITFSKILPEERFVSMKVDETLTQPCTFHQSRNWSCSVSPAGVVSASIPSTASMSAQLTLIAQSPGTADVTVSRNNNGSNPTDTYLYHVTVLPRLPEFSVTPYLQHPTPTEMTVRFFTRQACAATVSCDGRTFDATCEEATELVKVASDDRQIWGTQYRHDVRLTRLEPNTAYRYEVTLEGGESYSNGFHTAPADLDTPIRFIAYSDPECVPPDYKDISSGKNNNATEDGRVKEWDVLVNGRNETRTYHVPRSVGFASNLLHMASWKPDFYVVAGDLAARGGVQLFWDEYWKEMAGGLGRGYGDPAGAAPVLAVMGNQDHYDNRNAAALEYNMSSDEIGLRKYLTYFEFEPNGVDYANSSERDSKDRDRSQLFHRMDYGPVTILFLDTNKGGSAHSTSRAPSFDRGSLQYQWIEENLQDARDNRHSRFIFVVSHQDPYSCGKHNDPGDGQSTARVREQLTDLMLKYGVTGWFAGHDEMQEHAQVTGTETLPGGSTREHTMNVYDLGSAGDGLKGVRVYPDNAKYMVFAAYSDSPDGTHYGHLQVEVAPSNGVWYCTMTPAYSYFRDANSPSELRHYDDRTVIRERVIKDPEPEEDEALDLSVGGTASVVIPQGAKAWRLVTSDAAKVTAKTASRPEGVAVELSALHVASDPVEIEVYATRFSDGVEIKVKTIRVTVAPLAIVVTPQPAVRRTDEPDPAIAYTVAPAKLGSGEAIVLDGALAHDGGNAVGFHDVTLGTLTNGNNPDYAISLDVAAAKGCFQIIGVPTVRDAITATLTYGAAVVSATFGGTMAAPDGGELKGDFVFDDPDFRPSVAESGEYELVFRPEDAVNFDEVRVKVAVTVEPAKLTSASAPSQTYDATVKTPAVTARSGDLAVPEGSYEITDWSAEPKAAGTYSATVTGTGNFTGSVPLTFTIDPKSVTVQADALSKEFGVKDDPTLTATVTGLVGGDTIDYTLTRDAGESLGQYLVTPSGRTEQGSYLVTYRTAYFKITKAIPQSDGTLTATIAYGANLSGAAVVGTMKDRQGNVVEGTFTFDESGPLAVAEGGKPYTATFTPENRGTYDPTSVEVVVTVVRAVLTVKAKSYEITYGDDPPDYGYSLSGFVNGDNSGVVSGTCGYSCEYARGSDAGQYGILVESVTGLEAENYIFVASKTPGTLTVRPKPVTVTAQNAEKNYGQDDPTFTAKVTDSSGGELADDLVAYTLTRTTGTKAGSYTIIAEGETDQDNYQVTFKSGTFRINQAKIMSARAAPMPWTGSVLKPTVFVTTADGIELPADADCTVGSWRKSGSTWGTATLRDVGSYTATVSAKSGGNLTGSASVTFEITKADYDMSGVIFANKAYTYDGKAKTITITGTLPSGIRASYTNNSRTDAGEQTATVTFSGADGNHNNPPAMTAVLTIGKAVLTSATAANQVYDGTGKSPVVTVKAGTLDVKTFEVGWPADMTNVGTYVGSVTGAVNFAGTVDVAFTITRAKATVKANDASKAYGEEDPAEFAATVTGIFNGDALEYEVTRVSGEDVGEYAIKPIGVVDQGNYEVSYLSGTFRITKAAPKPAGVLTATIEYGRKPSDAEVGGEMLGLDGEPVSGSFAFADSGQPLAVGTHDVDATFLPDDADNLATVKASVRVTVVKRVLTVKAANTSVTYGTESPSYQFVLSGFIPGENQTSAGVTGEPTYSSTYAKTMSVGEYGFSVGTTGSLKADNYSFAVDATAATLKVTPRAVTVTSLPAEKTYGEENDPEFAATVTGLVNDEGEDLITYEFAREAGENVRTGGYRITPTGDPDQGNYTVTFKSGGVLTINPAKITSATAPDVEYQNATITPVLTVMAGDLEVPPESYSVGTWKWSKTEQSAGSGNTPRKTIGKHTATVTAKAGGNFTGSATVSFEIVKANYDMSGVTFADQTVVYDGKPHSLAISGTLPTKGVTTNARLSNPVYRGNGQTAVGDYEVSVTFTNGDANHYNTPTLTAKLSIIKATITEATAGGSTYDGTKKSPVVTAKAGTLPATVEVVGGWDGDLVDAGTYHATVRGTGNFGGDLEVSYILAPATLTEATAAAVTYTGRPQTPKLTVKAGDLVLGSGDYDLGDWSGDLTRAGTYTATVTGKGNFAGERTVSFTIEKATYDMSGVSFADGSVPYDGKPHSLAIAGDLPRGVTVAYAGNGQTDAGAHTVTARFTGDADNFKAIADKEAKLTIDRVTLTEVTAAAATYTGQSQTPRLTVKAGDFVLGGGDYDLSAWNETPKAAGTYTATVTAKSTSNFTGSLPVTFEIKKAPLTVAADDQGVEKDADPPPFTVTYSGFVPGEGESFLTGDLEFFCAYQKETAAVGDTFDIVPSGLTADNYDITFENGTLEVGKTTPKLESLTASAIDYGQTLGESVLEGTAQNGVTGKFEWTDGTIRPSVADSGKAHDVLFTPDDLDDYTIAHFKATVEVNPGKLTVTAVDTNVTYGAAAPDYSCVITGFVDGEDESVVTGTRRLTCPYGQFDDAGDYAITPDLSTFETDNYTFESVPGTLTVRKATVTVSAKDLSVTFWDPVPQYAAAFDGFLGDDTASAVSGSAEFSCAYAQGKDVGGYDIVVSQVSGLESVNYEFVASPTPGKLTVNRRPVTVTADNQSKPYGALDPTLTATVTGEVDGQPVAYDLAVDYKGASPLEASVGSYTIAVTVKGDVEQPNYLVTCISGRMEVTQASLVGEDLAATIEYGQMLGDAKVTGVVKSTSRSMWGPSASIAGTFAFADPTRVPAVAESGFYAVKFTPNNTWAYKETELAVFVTVTPKTLTVKAVDETIVYGDEPPAEHARTITGFIDKDDESVVSGTCGYTCEYAQFGGIGQYPIEVDYSGLSASNYVFAAAEPPGQLTVTPKTLTVKAADETITYGDAPPADHTCEIAGFVDGEDESVVSGACAYSCAYERYGSIGDYPIEVDYSGLSASNYVFAATETSGQLTVNPATVTEATAVSQTFTGDRLNPVVTVKAGDLTLKSGDYTVSNWSGELRDAGTYAATVTGTGNFTGTAGVTFEVTKATYDMSGVTFEDDAVTYDGNSHSLAYGGTLPDGVTVSYTDGEQTEAGPHTITAVFTGDANHHEIESRAAVLTIRPAPIATVEVEDQVYDGQPKVPTVRAFTTSGLSATIDVGDWSGDLVNSGTCTAMARGNGNFTGQLEAEFRILRASAKIVIANRTKEYSDEDPELTANVEGLFGTDSVGYELMRASGEEPGEYEIRADFTTPQRNYDVTATEGVFAIVPAKPVVRTGFEATLTYGEALEEAGFVAGEMIDHRNEPVDGRIVFEDPGAVLQVAESGGVDATFVPADTKRYDPVAVEVAVTVEPRELKVRAKDATLTYGDAPLTQDDYDYLCTGFVNGDESTVVTGVCAYACDYAQGDPTGLYAIEVTDVSRLGASNYCFAVDGETNGWLRVVRKEVVVTANDVSRTYGADDPELSVTIEGRVDEGDEILYSISRQEGTNVGDYTITPTGDAEQGDYAVTYRTGTFTIDPATLTSATAKPQTYDGEVRTPELTVKAGDRVLRSGDYALGDWNETPVAAGTYTATVTGTGNFTGELTVSFTITRATYDMSGVTFADGTVTYDTKPHTLVISGELPAGVTVTYEGGEKTAAGTYPMTATFTGDAANHEPIPSLHADLVIEPRTIAGAVAAAGESYDGKVHKPSLTVTAGGLTLAASDYALGPWSGELKDVGTYRASVTGCGNFKGTTDVYFSILPAKVTVTANAASKEYGADDPELTATVTGTLDGDTVAYAVTRAEGEELGSYVITPSGERNQGNYEVVSHKTGTFTITAATPSPKEGLMATITYGETLGAATVEGTMVGRRGEFVDGLLTFVEPDLMPSVAESGLYPAVFTPDDTTHYKVAEIEVAVTVGKKELIVQALDAETTYGKAAPEFGYELEGFVENEDAVVAGVTGEPTLRSAYAVGDNVGEYDIIVADTGDLAAANYSFAPSASNATLTVRKPESTDLHEQVSPEALAADPFVGNATYNGWTRGANGGITGQLVIKAGKPNKKTGISTLTVTYTPVGGKKTTVKVDARADENPEVFIPGIGTVVLSGDAIVGKDCNVQAGRDLFKDKAAKARAATVPVGVWTFALPSDNGFSGFSVTVAKTGKAKVAGVLTDGTKVSVSAQGIFGDSGRFAIPVIYAKKAVALAFVMWIDTVTHESGISDAMDVKWNVLVPSRDIALANGGHLVRVDGLDLTQGFTVDGKKWTFPKQNKKVSPDPNPTAMKLAWTQKTGVVKGSFSVPDGTGKKQKFTVNGVATGGVIRGTAFDKKLGVYLPFIAE